jgi:uncharacterized protein YdaU (DUF1376 family)
MSKQTDLWMPVYIGDYLRDTQRLTTEQHGAYYLLLLDYWTNGPLPADDAVLCSISRLKPVRFRKHKGVLLSFFTIEGGKLRHKRADAEKAKAEQHANRRSEKATKAAEARWHGSKVDAPSNAPSNARGYAPECPKPSPSFTIVKGASAPVDPSKFVFSEGVALLVRTGSAEGAARSFLGSLRKTAGDERLAELIEQAIRDNVSDPRAWLKAAVGNDPADELSAAISSMAARKANQAA